MKLVYSVLWACICGAIIAFILIWTIQYRSEKTIIGTPKVSILEKAEVNSIPSSALLEESDQDPSFVSRFSRVLIYSADDGKEVIQGARNSIFRKPTVKITAPSYVVIDLDRNAIILEKDSERLLPVASVTKLVTAVLVKKLFDQDASITMTRRALNTYGNEAWLREGEKMKVYELLYPLLMVSSNDASEVLAQSYSKGRQQFIKEMNNWTNSIGAYRTYFADPSGLSSKNVSSAKDLSIIVKWILVHEPELLDITLLKLKTIRVHTWTNPTHFLNLTSYAGGKNGYTPEANRTSVALFKLGKAQKLYGVILLGSEARDSDILDLLEEALK